jgi:hypothetical protein
MQTFLWRREESRPFENLVSHGVCNYDEYNAGKYGSDAF